LTAALRHGSRVIKELTVIISPAAAVAEVVAAEAVVVEGAEGAVARNLS